MEEVKGFLYRDSEELSRKVQKVPLLLKVDSINIRGERLEVTAYNADMALIALVEGAKTKERFLKARDRSLGIM